MSEKGKIKMPTSSMSIFRIILVVILFLALFCMLPLYLQNRLNSLCETSHKLAEQVTFLQRDALLLELKINQMSSLESLSPFAEEVGLGLNGVPVKVMAEGGSRE